MTTWREARRELASGCSSAKTTLQRGAFTQCRSLVHGPFLPPYYSVLDAKFHDLSFSSSGFVNVDDDAMVKLSYEMGKGPLGKMTSFTSVRVAPVTVRNRLQPRFRLAPRDI